MISRNLNLNIPTLVAAQWRCQRSNVRLRGFTSPMPEYADIYAAAADRTEQAITGFLDHFLPSRIESAEEYEIPQYSRSPHTVYATASEVIKHCCVNRREVHTIYWRSDSQPEHAMVFFLCDGGLIIGVSTPADDRQRVDRIARDLERFIDSEEVIVPYEDLPPQSTEDFRAFFRSLPASPDETSRQSRVHRPILTPDLPRVQAAMTFTTSTRRSPEK